MPFTFSNGAPVDQVLMPPMGWTPGQAPPQVDAAPQGAPAQLQQAPQPQATAMGGLPDIQVSPVEAFLSWAAHGGSPDEAAQRVRATKLANMSDRIQLQQAQEAMQAIQGLPQDQQLAIFLNRAEAGKALADRMATHTLSAGQMLTKGAPDGGPVYAPSFDDKSGIFAAPNAQGGVTRFGQLGGDYTANNGVVTSGRTGQIAGSYAMPQIVPKGDDLKYFNPGSPGAPQTASGLGAPVAATGLLNQNGRLDPGAFFKSFVLPHEGGYSSSDGNGAPVNMGVNQAANPGVDVSKLSAQQAQDIFTNKYFARSGAANLPPALAAVHADTYFIRPQIAQQLLQQSGGDPTKYLALRQAWMNNLEQSNPAMAKYAPAWNSRNAALGSLIQQLGGSQAQAGSSTGGGSGPTSGTVSPGQTARILSQAEAQAAGFEPGAVVQQDPDGKATVVQAPEYGSDWRKGLRQQLLESEPYKQNGAASSALQALQHNVGQLTGPAAYTLLDTMARTINPGAVARQGTIKAIEDMLGLPAHAQGWLMNLQGQGRLPMQTQQQILDAVTPFAQAHWDQAKQLYDANANLASAHKLDPAEVTAPIGDRPIAMHAGAVPAPQQRPPGIYQTPKGLMNWTGTGWLKVN